jgi:hypothetical protein
MSAAEPTSLGFLQDSSIQSTPGLKKMCGINCAHHSPRLINSFEEPSACPRRMISPRLANISGLLPSLSKTRPSIQVKSICKDAILVAFKGS